MYVTRTPRTQTKSIMSRCLILEAASTFERERAFLCPSRSRCSAGFAFFATLLLDSLFSCLMKHLSFFYPPSFHSGPCFSIRLVHSVLFHFLMTVQPVSQNELTHVLLVTLRHSFRLMYCMAASDFQA